MIGEWTGWRERTIFGDSVIDCLQEAVQLRTEWKAGRGKPLTGSVEAPLYLDTKPPQT